MFPLSSSLVPAFYTRRQLAAPPQRGVAGGTRCEQGKVSFFQPGEKLSAPYLTAWQIDLAYFIGHGTGVIQFTHHKRHVTLPFGG
jgi:hypothetical protein